MSDMTHRQFFGDKERAFTLTHVEIAELERVLNAGIGTICLRLMASQFFHNDLVQIIRLGLVGAGTNPEEAAALVAAYGASRPIEEIHPLALAIVERLWFGKAHDTKDEVPA
jgi:hypothetical protein